MYWIQKDAIFFPTQVRSAPAEAIEPWNDKYNDKSDVFI